MQLISGKVKIINGPFPPADLALSCEKLKIQGQLSHAHKLILLFLPSRRRLPRPPPTQSAASIICTTALTLSFNLPRSRSPCFCFHNTPHLNSFKSRPPLLLKSSSPTHTHTSLFFYLQVTRLNSTHRFLYLHFFRNPKMKFLSLSALAIVAVVNAQTPTPDACILTCAEQACPSEFSGANVTDYSCFCTTGTAQIIGCLNANCTAADLTTAEELATAVCGGKHPLQPSPPSYSG